MVLPHGMMMCDRSAMSEDCWYVVSMLVLSHTRSLSLSLGSFMRHTIGCSSLHSIPDTNSVRYPMLEIASGRCWNYQHSVVWCWSIWCRRHISSSEYSVRYQLHWMSYLLVVPGYTCVNRHVMIPLPPHSRSMVDVTAAMIAAWKRSNLSHVTQVSTSTRSLMSL
jgi:hypothetical protein